MKTIAAFLVVAGLGVSLSQEHSGGHALFVRTSPSTAGKGVGRVRPDGDIFGEKYETVYDDNDERI